MKQLITRRKQRARRRRAFVALSVLALLFLQTCKDKGSIPLGNTAKVSTTSTGTQPVSGSSILTGQTSGGFSLISFKHLRGRQMAIELFS